MEARMKCTECKTRPAKEYSSLCAECYKKLQDSLIKKCGEDGKGSKAK